MNINLISVENLVRVACISSALAFGQQASALDVVERAPAAQFPEYQRLLNAQQRVRYLVQQVQQLTWKATGQQTGDACQTLPYQWCVQRSDCGWRTLDNGARGFCLPRTPRVAMLSEDDNENDHLAALGLQALSISMTRLSQNVDYLVLNYGNPAAFTYHIKACEVARENMLGAKGVEIAASLPMQGNITPSDLIPLEQEIQAVKADINCMF